MLRLFGSYLKPYIGFIILAICMSGIQALGELMLPNVMSDIVDVGIVNGDVPYIIDRGLVMIVWTLVASAALVLASFAVARTSIGFGRDVRSAIFTRVQSLSIFQFDKLGTSTLITRNTNDVQQLERVIQMLIKMLVFSTCMLVGALVMTFQLSTKLAIVTLCGVPVLIGGGLIILKFGMPFIKVIQSKIDRLNLVTREGLSGIRVIRAYNKEPYERERFRYANRDLTETNVRMFRTLALIMPFASLAMNAVIIAICWVGAVNIQAGSLMTGDLMAAIQYVLHVLVSIMFLSMLIMVLPRAAVAARRIREVLEMEPEIADAHDCTCPDACVAGGETVLRFDDVSFTFPDSQVPVLRNLDFELRAGTTTAVIGSTGSGKSTVINLILRFCEPDSGTVSFLGSDIRSVSQKELRESISLVPQKATLFSGTIADNIRFGNADADDEYVRKMARIAQAEEFILEKEDGYETEVAQDGSNLSGGQRQRLAIARALCKDAQLYIFDDSFSALDFRTDADLRAALRSEMHGKTVLIVAQRVNVAMDADQVIVLDEGIIVGIGTHEQLLASCPTYLEIARSQLSDEELGIIEPTASVSDGGGE